MIVLLLTLSLLCIPTLMPSVHGSKPMQGGIATALGHRVFSDFITELLHSTLSLF